MIASGGSSLWQSHDVLRDLLHFVSQPLTTLHCALESSLAQREAEPPEDVCLALEQTERVIDAVRLMREYLEAEDGCRSAAPVPLSAAIDRVLEQLSVLAEGRGLRLLACGSSNVLIPVRDGWLQRALLYLVGTLVENEPPGRAITVLIEDGASQSILSGYSLLAQASLDGPPRCSPVSSTLGQVRVAIARRVLESSGASVEFYADDKPGFTIRIPHPVSALKQLSA